MTISRFVGTALGGVGAPFVAYQAPSGAAPNQYQSLTLGNSGWTPTTGDLVLVLLTGPPTSYAAPSGWTLLGSGSANNSNNVAGSQLWAHNVTSAEAGGSSIAVNLPSAGEPYAWMVYRSTLGVVLVSNAQYWDVASPGGAETFATVTPQGTAWQGMIAWADGASGPAAGEVYPLNVSPAMGAQGTYSAPSGYGASAAWFADSGAPISSGTSYTVNNSTNGDGYSAATYLLSEALTPSAPTLTSPPNATYQDLSNPPTFAWDYNNTDGSTEAGFQLRIKVSGASSYSYLNTSTAALQSTAVTNASTSLSVTLPSGIVANGTTYNWSIASYSSYGLLGPFASDFTLVGQAQPTVGMTGPTGTITSATTSVTWAPVFPSGASQTAYQIWVYAQSTTTQSGFTVGQSAGLVWGSGLVNSSAIEALTGALPNAQTLVFYLQLTETGGELSPIASTTATVSFTPPAVPLITATETTLASGLPVIQIDVQGHDNLLSADDASSEGGLGTLAAGANTTIAQSAAESLNGSYSVSMTSAAAGAMSFWTSPSVYAVVPNAPYTIAGFYRAAATPESCRTDVAWYASGGALISTTQGNPVTDSTTGWVASIAEVTSPSNAAFAQLVTNVLSTAAASEVHYSDDRLVAPGNLGYMLEVLSDSPVAYWPLTDPAGSATVIDATGNGNTGTVNGGVTLGEPGPIAQFPNETSGLFSGSAEYIGTSAIPTTLPVTIEAWGKIDTSGTNVLIGSGNAPEWWLGVNSSGNAHIEGSNGTTVTSSTNGTVNLDDGGWHHLVGQWESTGVTLYVDGVAVGSNSGTISGLASTPGFPAYGGGFTWLGEIAHAAVYAATLSAARIAAHYNAALATGSLVEKWTPGGFVGQQQVTVTRSDGFVLRASPLTLDSLTQQGTFYDVETTPGVAVTYSATVSFNFGNSSLTSLPNESASVSTTTDVWWLVNPLDTTLAVSPFVTSFTMTQMEQATAHTVLGQAFPTVVSSVMGGKDGQLTVQTTSSTEWAAIESVINSRAILWMTNSLGDGLYVRVGPAPGGMSSGYGLQSKQAQMVRSPSQNPVRTITLQYQEVAQP